MSSHFETNLKGYRLGRVKEEEKSLEALGETNYVLEELCGKILEH